MFETREVTWLMVFRVFLTCFSVSLQLQCDKTEITAHVGDEFILRCTYDTTRWLYSKKYWCRGESRSSCEVLVDSEQAGRRSHIYDAGRRGLYVKVTDVQLVDSGVFWVGIDKIYADIMTSVRVVITEGKQTIMIHLHVYCHTISYGFTLHVCASPSV